MYPELESLPGGKKMKKQGFTIVELLMVVVVISALAAIVTTVAMGAVRNSRENRAIAMGKILQSGLETYYSREGKWPSAIENAASRSDRNVVKLTTDDGGDDGADAALREIVDKSFGSGKNPYVDTSMLFVAKTGTKADKNGKSYGMNLTDAINKRLSVSGLIIGYANKKKGYFRRYVVKYNVKQDSVTVELQNN